MTKYRNKGDTRKEGFVGTVHHIAECITRGLRHLGTLQLPAVRKESATKGSPAVLVFFLF